MPIDRIQFQVAEEQEGKRLDVVLAEHFADRNLSKSQIRKLVIAGAVYLNRKRVRIASKPLREGAWIEVMVDWGKIQNPARQLSEFILTSEHVLYEDEFLIAIDKPAGVPTQPTLDEARVNLFASVKKFLQQREREAGEAYAGLHHRLDRDTSGVVLFTKKKEINGAIGDLFQKHGIQKTYQALTELPKRAVPDAWVVQNFLGQLSKSGKQAQYGAVRSGGLAAETHFRVLERMKRGLSVEAKPKTGRTHQIRVHLSEAGLPILGDFLYGRTNPQIPRMMLHAASLTFEHPISKNQIFIQSSLPKDFLQCLQQLHHAS